NVLNLAGSVGDMLAEARGYHLSLTLAHQNLTQLPRETQLALSANARNKIYFSCSPEDAHQLARHTLPELDEHDVAHLDAYTAAHRLELWPGWFLPRLQGRLHPRSHPSSRSAHPTALSTTQHPW